MSKTQTDKTRHDTVVLVPVTSERIAHRPSCRRAKLDSPMIPLTEAVRKVADGELTACSQCKPLKWDEWIAVAVEGMDAELATVLAPELTDGGAAAESDDLPEPLTEDERKDADEERRQRRNAIAQKHAARVKTHNRPELEGGSEPTGPQRLAARARQIKADKDAAKTADRPAADPGTVTPETPHGTTRVTRVQSKPAPEAGEPQDMRGKTVRAGSARVAYVSRTPKKTGSGYVRMEWRTEGGTTIVWDWPSHWTVGGKPQPDVKSLTEAVAVADR